MKEKIFIVLIIEFLAFDRLYTKNKNKIYKKAQC